ncbi:Peptidase aspartic [Cordyceps fumosorosea ARSEF 2679]|uniref:Peptidase aspartic n=1 Tax=Cordyceps fumosorosea (strain ARSEF 2679) TaxID=1081104 RepID=A0A167MC13_CORFA|nr:Peptidase aspartic [Cordyceps fumosorosea ARSEF 2679]OAA54184.1 Peptidase aspartic [Cordyceps fumosorosea ARSEF 2679]
MVWSPDGNRVCGIRTPEIRGTLGRIPVRALPDWGSAVNAVSEAFARRHNLEIDTTTSVCSIPLMGGNVAHSIGRVTGCFKFKGRGSSSHRCEFHVLRKSLHDVILGRAFLDETETLTLYSHRIVQVVRPCLRRGKRLFLLDNETPKAARIRCAVNGASASAFPDTGSDLMLVSGDFARRNGFKVHRGKKYRSRVELIDGSTILTDGMVLDAKLQFDVPPLPSLHEVDYDAYGSFLSGLSHLTGRGRRASSMMTFICDLHVVEDLPCDIILSHDFIFRNQVFSRFNSLFHSGRDETRQKDAASVDRCLMFVRSKSSKLSWFRRRRPRPPSETLDLPLRSSPSWDDLWELEVAQRNRMQLWIASLSEPQKSVEERNEAQRRALWDRENPRPPPTPAPSSDPSLRRIPVSRPSPAASQTGASSITAAVSAVSG